MQRTSIALALVGVLASSALADLPAKGILVATQTSFGESTTKETLAIHRVKPTGIEEVHAAATDSMREFGWTDARTLWVMDQEGATKIIGTCRAGTCGSRRAER